MNKIFKLFDEKFVKDLFTHKVLPQYPDFVSVKKIVINAHKKWIWETTYHVVIEFKTLFKTKEGKTKELQIFCSAHSHEPRKNVYDGLRFLWSHNFGRGYLTIPHPLFYSEEFRATFYRGVSGHNLYHYIKENNYEETERVVIKAAAWFAKLHRLSIKGAANFNEANSRIATVIPGAEHVLDKVRHKYPEHYDLCKKIYDILINKEELFFSNSEKRWLVHGDAHPENVIKMGKKKIALIDFTDLCLADFARDLGSFLQQLDYMCGRKIEDKAFVLKIRNIFLENYLKNAKIKMDESLEERIKVYYNWTAFRTAIFFLTSHFNKGEKAGPLLREIADDLGIK